MSPEFGIVNERDSGEFRVLSIDTEVAKYQGHPWKTLSEFQRRKFENLLIINRPKQRLKFIYG